MDLAPSGSRPRRRCYLPCKHARLGGQHVIDARRQGALGVEGLHDVAAAEELAAHPDLRERRPLPVLLDALPMQSEVRHLETSRNGGCCNATGSNS